MKIVVSGLTAFLDGEYEFDYEHLTNADLRLIKREANVRAGELGEALAAGDNDLLVCFALIALARAGKEIEPSVLWDAETGLIQVDLTDEEEAGESPPSPGSGESESANTRSLSPDSNGAGEHIQESEIPSGTGSHG